VKVEIEKRGSVGRIVYAHPPHNHVSVPGLTALADAVEELDRDPAIRATVLSTEGRIFCAGADLAGDAEMQHGGGAPDDPMLEFYRQAVRLYKRQKPIVAAVQGPAIGAGLGLATMADFRVAGPDARLSANFARLGFHPGFGISLVLPRLIGAQRATWMCLSSERVKPQEALAWGLVDKLVPTTDVTSESFRMAEIIAENAPLALLSVRATLMGSLASDVEEHLHHEYAEQTKLKATADYEEGVASVFARRPANFTGR